MQNHCRSSRSTADLYHLSGRFARTGGKRFSGTSLCQARLGAGCCILNPTDGRFGGRRERAMEKMKVRFDRCKGCGLCVSVCPKKLVKLQTEKRNEKGYFTAVCTDQDACISCAMCAMMCPDCAIQIENRKKA